MSDLSFAELALKEGYFTQVCFTCQQVAEKSLKAYLFSRQQPLLRSHILPRLVHECQSFDAQFAELEEACDILTGYYTDTRYPDSPAAREKYDSSVARQAVHLASQVLDFVKPRIEAALGPARSEENHT